MDRGIGGHGMDSQFEQAWRAHHAALVRRARRLTGGHADRADELLATTALKALLFMRHSPRFMDRPKNFLFVVLRHVFLDSVRCRVREGLLFDDSVDILEERTEADTEPSAMQRLEHHQQIAGIAAALHAMTPAQQRLFVFRFLDDLPYPLISERLGINQPLVRKRVQLIRERLRGALAGTVAKRDADVFTSAGGERQERNGGARRAATSQQNKGPCHG